MLDRNERIIVEAVKKARAVVIELEDGSRIRVAGDAPHEIGNALQSHFSNNHKNVYKS